MAGRQEEIEARAYELSRKMIDELKLRADENEALLCEALDLLGQARASLFWVGYKQLIRDINKFVDRVTGNAQD